jgi:hypothetical protein
LKKLSLTLKKLPSTRAFQKKLFATSKLFTDQ